MKPFIRWVGGKSRMLPVIRQMIGPAPIRNYFEPCLGGGAVFFDIYERVTGNSYLSDQNEYLMCAYRVVRDRLPELVKCLQDLTTDYYETRQAFNARTTLFVPRAAWFLALNHQCFNGLWRENTRGRFNVPLGTDSKKNPRTMLDFDYDRLVRASLILNQRTNLGSLGFSELNGLDSWLQTSCGPGDVVFYDPPYLGEFSGYNAGSFGAKDHWAMHLQATQCAAKGARVIVCGSDNESSRIVYGKPTLVSEVQRTVGCKNRKKATEAFYLYGF